MAKTWTPKLKAEQYNRIKEGEWFEFIDFNEAREQHKKNIQNFRDAVEEYNQTDRPLRILAIHGSGRSTNNTCAYELSNSKLFLQGSLNAVEEIDPSIEIDQISLRDYNIEPCNNCVSTTSTLCGFPCDCFPFDPMQEIYPKLLRSDIIFCSTGVNQSTMSTRLKAMCDRMISLDGGFFREELEPKDGAFKDRMLALSASGNIAYDQRLYGRVGGYFVSSKDESNKHPTVNLLHHFEAREREGLSHNPLYDTGFCELTAHVLRDGMEAYGFFHAPNYYACAPANPDEDYMYDKEYMMNDLEALDAGKQVVKDAITLAKELKENLPEFYPDRFNRT